MRCCSTMKYVLYCKEICPRTNLLGTVEVRIEINLCHLSCKLKCVHDVDYTGGCSIMIITYSIVHLSHRAFGLAMHCEVATCRLKQISYRHGRSKRRRQRVT
jgi:hypothetical protein